MAENEPYNQLTGVYYAYVALPRSTPPALPATPNLSTWYRLGPTDGDHTENYAGALTLFYDDDHDGPVKAIRPQQDLTYTFTLVNMTLEQVQRVLSSVHDVVTTGTTTPVTRTAPLKRDRRPTEYALLLYQAFGSPYGEYPGYIYVPRGVFDGEPTITRSKSGRAALECTFRPLEDDFQTNPRKRMGWRIAQVS